MPTSIAGRHFHSAEFMQEHSQFLRKSIDLVPNVHDLPREKIDAGIETLLGHLASIVKAYNRQDRVKVNANYMIPVTPTTELRDRGLFTRRDRDPHSFQCFLQLVLWSHPDGACPSIALPVEKPNATEAVIFGAPKAFVYQQPEIISDTLDLLPQIGEHETEAIRRDMSAFFQAQKQRLRSFVSFPVLAPGTAHSCPYPVVGIVNIDSTAKNLMGRHFSNQHKLCLALEPAIHILSYFLALRHFPPIRTEES